ncbi:glutaredoxin 3 [Rhodoferax sp.]|uniref:glutaredoxin 3 n=1 Tax=Rhodoferax sp. TaxID=50421 RepID=UPI0019EBF348|nr:glutaredoxin 3 [Rhodoferax sp.]MBE0473245.1 glutaredoxin 3 [Rhodoferax sp.]
MADITMYSAQGCGYCQSAERLLARKGITQFKKIRVDTEPGVWEAMAEKTGRRTVPQIFIGDIHVGGFDDLNALDKARRLDELLQA